MSDSRIYERNGKLYVKCIESGAEIAYRGHGRPPLYHPNVKKAKDVAARKARYAAKTAKKQATKQAAAAKLAA